MELLAALAAEPEVPATAFGLGSACSEWADDEILCPAVTAAVHSGSPR